MSCVQLSGSLARREHGSIEEYIAAPRSSAPAASALAIENISATLNVNARDVSFTSVMTSFVTDGRIRLITCGRMILKKVCAFP